MIAIAKAEKWTRQADGSYTMGEFRIEKNPAKWSRRFPWILTHPQLEQAHFETLAKAKDFGPRKLAEEQAKIRTGIMLERRERALEIVKRCRIKDAKEYTPAMGIGYMDYIAIKVGTTAEAVRAESDRARAEELVLDLANEPGYPPLECIAAELVTWLDADSWQQVAVRQAVITSGKVTIILDKLPPRDSIDDQYRATIVWGHSVRTVTCEADSDLDAAVDALDKIPSADKCELVTEKILDLTTVEPITRPGLDKPWGHRHNYLLTDAEGKTCEAYFCHQPFQTYWPWE
jgi:hypothetical protein